MIKLKNPFNRLEEYNCFGCCADNKIGLQLTFYYDEETDEVVSYWSPNHEYEGWVNVVHGGIQSTILDELASWVVFTKCDSIGVTSKMNVNYIKSVFVSNKQLEIRGKLKSFSNRFAEIWVGLYNDEKELCTEADITYFVYPKRIAKAKFHYKGKESFYPK